MKSAAPFALFALLFALAEAALLAQGARQLTLQAGREATAFAVLCGLTWIVTRGRVPRREPESTRAPWVQVALCLVVIVATGIAASLLVPPSMRASHGAFGAGFLLGFGVVQFFAYVVLTSLLLLPFRIPSRYLGLQPELRVSLAAGAVWLLPVAAILLTAAVTGKETLSAITSSIAVNVFSNGFSEEFLFRGALMSRLTRVVSAPWALFTQAAIFGAWHFGANMRGLHGDLPLVFLAMVVNQMLFGYAMGFVTVRSGSILVPSAFHALYDAVPCCYW